MTSYCGLSIITVTKHDDLRLQATKKSLRDQNEKLFEHLIISYEDLASPGRWEKVSVGQDNGYLETKIAFQDTGIYMAMNLGLLQAKGDWVLFLNSGDSLFTKDSTKTIRRSCGKKNVAHYVAPFYYKRSNAGSVYNLLGFADPVESFRLGALICQQAILYRRTELKRLGGFDQSYQLAGDYEMFCRILMARQEVRLLPSVITTYTDGGLSETRSHECSKEIHRARERYVDIFN